MTDVSISDFRENCSRLIKQLARTKKTLRITLRGRPVAEVTSLQNDRKRFVVGDMVGTAEIVGDIVSPVIAVGESLAETTRK
jgi:prevent-host-death family protein